MDSTFKIGKNYYREVFLEECKYVVNENMFINAELEIFSGESDDSDDVEDLVLIIVYK